MATSSPDLLVSTFVLRFWREWSATGPRWRGQIDHVQSGASVRFLALEEMSDVIQSFGVMTGKARQPDDVICIETLPRAERFTGLQTEALADKDRIQHDEDAAE